MNTDSSSSSDDTIDLPLHDPDAIDYLLGPVGVYGCTLGLLPVARPTTVTLKPTADDIAMTHFFNQFTTSNGHWDFILNYASKSRLDPCLDLAIRACGMAALDNVESVAIGRDYARSMYVEALGLLNAALRDPKRCRTDESLIAVAMLGYYENLTCDSRESIQSWKAHISGATQLLKIRGKAQFKTAVGRLLFRETRAQVLVHCLWDDLEPPAFLWDWEDDLAAQSTELQITRPADALTKICYDFAIVRSQMQKKTISNTAAAAQCTAIDRRMMEWQTDTLAACGPTWQYTALEVPDSPHVWNGMVHAYDRMPAPGVWNTFRSIRILVTRTQELLCRRFHFTPAEREEQTRYFRKVRRQMTDDICAGIPTALGHAAPAYNSSCTLISAYGSIWPIFFAATCALERVSISQSPSQQSKPNPASTTTSAAAAQAAWLLSRLDYISQHVGLRWASGIAAVLKGDFSMHDNLLPEDEEGGEGQKMPGWIKRIYDSGRGPRILMEKEGPLSEALEQDRRVYGPIWLGRGSGAEEGRREGSRARQDR